jgi:Na+/H+-dicarboxylate symporter/ABC-type amino acid transport substrate-binding protein
LFGLFVGEIAAPLKVVGDAFIQLLQITVLPYITLSLITSLGRLSYQQAKTLAVKVGGLLLLLWGIALILVFTFPLAFPSWESASFFSTTLVQGVQDVDFLELYIPANPFYSLANNIVPAVVLFSVLVGVALIGIEAKDALIDNLTVLVSALSRVTHFVVRLTPIGIFAIAASTAGTMSIEEFGRLQVFLVTYVLASLLVTFWILPGLVTALTPLTYREVVGLTKDALITAFATGNLFVVLPILSEKCQELLRKHKMGESQSLVDVIVPVSFNFPNTGKVLTLSFILFAAWFSDTPVTLTQYPTFAASGLISFFANLNVAVPFLLDLLRIPADMFHFFVVSSVVNSRFGTLIAAMHTVVLALVGTYAISGQWEISFQRLLRYALVTVVLTAVTIGGTRGYFAYALENEYHKDEIIAEMQMLRNPVPATVHTSPPTFELPGDARGSRMERIREDGSIRVGYLADQLPFVYFNAAGDLVGFDVEMAHRLARELEVRLEFVPVLFDEVAEGLNSGYCDIVMSGLGITTKRAQEMAFSRPYLEGTLAFLVRDHRRGDFDSREAVQGLDAPKIALPNLPYFVEWIRTYLPQAQIVLLSSWPEFFEREQEEDLDAMFTAAEIGSAWSLMFPEYTVVVPHPDVVRTPAAYAMPRGDHELVNFVSSWIELKKSDGTIESLYDHWILGKTAVRKQPRWSVIRDLLHWVE